MESHLNSRKNALLLQNTNECCSIIRLLVERFVEHNHTRNILAYIVSGCEKKLKFPIFYQQGIKIEHELVITFCRISKPPAPYPRVILSSGDCLRSRFMISCTPHVPGTSAPFNHRGESMTCKGTGFLNEQLRTRAL